MENGGVLADTKDSTDSIFDSLYGLTYEVKGQALRPKLYQLEVGPLRRNVLGEPEIACGFRSLLEQLYNWPDRQADTGRKNF